eukprot:gene14904-biopygen12677
MPWNTVERQGVSQSVIEYHRVLQSVIEYHGEPRSIAFDFIPPNSLNRILARAEGAGENSGIQHSETRLVVVLAPQKAFSLVWCCTFLEGV